jgi:hypothetical protein
MPQTLSTCHERLFEPADVEFTNGDAPGLRLRKKAER